MHLTVRRSKIDPIYASMFPEQKSLQGNSISYSLLENTDGINKATLTSEAVNVYNSGRYFCNFTDMQSAEDTWTSSSIYVFVNG